MTTASLVSDSAAWHASGAAAGARRPRGVQQPQPLPSAPQGAHRGAPLPHPMLFAIKLKIPVMFIERGSAQSLTSRPSGLLCMGEHATSTSPCASTSCGRRPCAGAQAARDALSAVRCDTLRAKSWARAGDALGALGRWQLARLCYEQVPPYPTLPHPTPPYSLSRTSASFFLCFAANAPDAATKGCRAAGAPRSLC